MPMHGQPFSALVTLPPLATIWLVPDQGRDEERIAALTADACCRAARGS